MPTASQAPAPTAPTLVPNTPATATAEPAVALAPDDVVDAGPSTESAAELRRQRLALFGGIDVADVTLCIGYRDAAGVRKEVIRQVTDGAEFRITKCNHGIEEVLAVKKAEGEIIGHEPTGRYRLKIEVDFVRT